jgi:hypothetical protein
MRHIAVLSLISILAMPACALAQEASAPPPDQPAMQPPPDGQYVARAASGHHDGGMAKMQAKFEAANTTHDGRLTLQQAEAAGLKPVVEHFSAIDTANRGYVTFNELMAWHLDEKAQKMERKAAELRSQD